MRCIKSFVAALALSVAAMWNAADLSAQTMSLKIGDDDKEKNLRKNRLKNLRKNRLLLWNIS